jgi:NADH-quinone oxidoreductase subunit L
MTFLGKPRWDDDVHPHESPATMTVPLIILAIFSVTIGGINTPWRLAFEHFLHPSFEAIQHEVSLSDAQIFGLAVFALVVAIAGIAWGWKKYHTDDLPAEDGAFWRRSLAAYGVDDLYGKYIVAPGKNVSEWASGTFDQKVLDGSAHGIGTGVRSLGDLLAKAQTGQVRGYAGGVAVGGLLLVIVFLVVGGGF